MIYNINTVTEKTTWREREESGMAKSLYCKKPHRCYDCQFFQTSYECWTCQKQSDSTFIHKSNHNLKVDAVMDIFESNCQLPEK